MPRPPESARETEAIPDVVYSPLGTRGEEVPAGLCPLHVGDSWLEPFAGARLEDVKAAEHPGLHRYTGTRGIPALVDALVERSRARGRPGCQRESVLVTGGATVGLACAVGAVAAPGEEVLILAPFWPLIRGIVQTLRAVPVEVPFFDRVDSAEAALQAVRERLTRRSVALYFSSPSNPTGRVLAQPWLEALAGLARRENLWLLSDEVYEDFVYRGEAASVGALAPERTLSVHSFSKAYAMAGYRIGYLVGPEPIVGRAARIGTHTFYSACTASQVAALRALEGGGEWLARARASHREAGESAARALGLPPPEGGAFLLADASDALDERGTPGFLRDCVDAGVALAPGASCGAAYESFVRLCFTAAPPGEVKAAVQKVARLLAR